MPIWALIHLLFRDKFVPVFNTGRNMAQVTTRDQYSEESICSYVVYTTSVATCFFVRRASNQNWDLDTVTGDEGS